MSPFQKWFSGRNMGVPNVMDEFFEIERKLTMKGWNAAIEAALALLDENDPPLLAGELECLKEPAE